MVLFDELRISPKGDKLIIDAHVNKLPYYNDIKISNIYINNDKGFLESGLNKNAIVYSKNFVTSSSIKIMFSSTRTLFGNNVKEVSITLSDNYGIYEDINLTKRVELSSLQPDSKKVPITYLNGNIIGFTIKGKTYYFNHYYEVIQISKLNEDVIYFSQDIAPKEIRLEVPMSEILDSNYDNLFFVYIKTIGAPSDCTPCGFDGEYTIGITFDANMLYQKSLEYLKDLAGCNISKNFIDYILNYEMLKASIETEHYIDAVNIFNRMFRGTSINNIKCYGKNSI